MIKKFTDYFAELIQDQLRGLIIGGILGGIISNLIVIWTTSYYEKLNYRREAFLELSERMQESNQAILYSFDSDSGFSSLKEMYEKTQSATDNSKFEGRRIDNIIYDLVSSESDETMKNLLMKIKFIRNDVPIGFVIGQKSEEKDRESLSKISRKISDYRCCVIIETGIESNPACELNMKQYGKLLYCLHDGSKLIVPP